MLMTLLGRQVPECDPKLMFGDDEMNFLSNYAVEAQLEPPDTLGKAVRLIADLGGYRGRKLDPDPGHQIMWFG